MYIDRRFRSAGDYTMAVSEKSVQPQGGVYGWYAERNADSIAISSDLYRQGWQGRHTVPRGK